MTLDRRHLDAQPVAAAPVAEAVRARRVRVSSRELVLLGVISYAAAVFTDDWIAGVAMIVLWLIWRVLRVDEGPPVLALAMTFQWSQTVVGIFYYALTGRMIATIALSDYRPMVLMGLGCVTALTLGLAWGLRLMEPPLRDDVGPEHSVRFYTLVVAYLLAIPLTGVLQELAWQYPTVTQGILAISYIRLGLLFLMFRRLMWPRVHGLGLTVLLVTELLLGFTGYFAGFREPMVLAAIALLERFDSRRTSHWVALGALSLALSLAGILWMGVREQYRQDFMTDTLMGSRTARLERMATLSSTFVGQETADMLYGVDALVDRMWVVYYPALALKRVPDVLPHTDGQILLGALAYTLMPRFFFVDKAVLESDSEMVKKYSGVFVAGAEQNTSIAFGYAIESYIDFGWLWMFVPVLLWGLFLGLMYRVFMRKIRHRDLAVAFVSVVFWMSLYLFERSWVKSLGLAGTLMIYIGLATIFLDRLLLTPPQAAPAPAPGDDEGASDLDWEHPGTAELNTRRHP